MISYKIGLLHGNHNIWNTCTSSKNDQVQHRFTLTKSKRMSTYKTVTTVPGKHEIPIECLRLVCSLNRL